MRGAEEYRQQIEQELAECRALLEQYKSGKLTSRWSEARHPLADITAEVIEFHKRNVAFYEEILAKLCREDE